MGVLRSFRRVLLLLSIVLIGSLAVSSCSLVPDSGISSGDSGQDSSSGSGSDGAEPGMPVLPSNLAGVGANVEACLSVTAVVVGGSGLVVLAKVGGAEDSVLQVQKLVREAEDKVPSEVKGDLENLLRVLDASVSGQQSLDEENVSQALKPISAWLDKNCKGN